MSRGGVLPSVLLVLSGFALPARARPSDGVELGAKLGVTERTGSQRELVFLLSLELPLDRVRAPVLAERSARRREQPEPPPSVEPAPPPRAREAEPPPEWTPPRARLTPALARATLVAALRAAGRPIATRRLDGLSSRARSSAILPTLRLRAERTTDESLRLAPTSGDPYRYTRAGGASLTFEAQASWRLDRLVFATDEVEVERLRRASARSDAELTREVLGALVAWQRALWAEARPELGVEDRLAAELGRVEAEVRLDVLTGGRFSELAGIRREKRLAEPPGLE